MLIVIEKPMFSLPDGTLIMVSVPVQQWPDASVTDLHADPQDERPDATGASSGAEARQSRPSPKLQEQQVGHSASSDASGCRNT